MSPLSGWENFYVIVGSSAGALTGLTFVAITLVGEAQRGGAGRAIPAFTTPTVVQFGVALLLAAILSAPWSDLAPLSVALILLGLGMLAYGAIVVRRIRGQESYEPELEDWLWYGIVPLIATVALIVAAILLMSHPTPALFIFAGVILLLMFNALHNAWDLVTWITIQRVDTPQNDTPQHESERKE
ncbi:MAG TPA: hypothetical protein VE338_04045 [Ktedonobacterales bacterium]|nr:hypothetical protein [Ktedonobacterales bacterium]